MVTHRSVAENLVFLPLDVAAEPPAGNLRHFKYDWWITDPNRGVLFYRTPNNLCPQCNSDSQITEKINSHVYGGMEFVVAQVPHVFIRVDYEGRYSLPTGG